MIERSPFPSQAPALPIAIGVFALLVMMPAPDHSHINAGSPARTVLSVPGALDAQGSSGPRKVERSRPSEASTSNLDAGAPRGYRSGSSEPPSRWIDVGLIGVVELSPDFAWADLSDADLRWAHFFRPDFSSSLLTGANLGGASFVNASFEGAVLVDVEARAANMIDALMQRVDLSWANLHSSTLIGAVLTEAIVRGADLRSVNLASATLQDADLSQTDLRGAYLTEANLRGANLSDADLRSANLTSADLRGADLSGANIEDVDLSATFVGRSELRTACGNSGTRLPFRLHGFVLRICD